MKTKKSEEFLEKVMSLPRAKFAVVGKNTTWMFYEGADLAKATAESGESLIRCTCKRKSQALVVNVVGGQPEITLLKNKVFAAHLKDDSVAMTFKALSAEDNAEIERLLLELQTTLTEQVGQAKSPLRETVVPIFNQALDAATDGDLPIAKARVQELKAKLAPPRPTQPLPPKPLPPTPSRGATQPTQPTQPAKPPAKPVWMVPPTPDVQQARTLAKQIMQIAQAVQPTSPDQAQSLLADIKTHMATADDALRIELLQALHARALEIQDVENTLAGLPGKQPPPDDGLTVDQLTDEVWALLENRHTAPSHLMKAWQALEQSVMSTDMIADTDPEKRTRFRELRAEALKLTAAADQKQKLDDLYYDLLKEDKHAIRAILAEMAYFPPEHLKRTAQYRARFKKASDADDADALKTLLAELERLPEVERYKSEAPAKAKAAVATIKKVTPPEKLKDLPVKERIDLLMSLRRGGGIQNDECREAMIAMQKQMKLEPDFLENDDELRKQVRDKLKESKALQNARRDWHLPEGDVEARKAKRLVALQGALQIQCAAMNMPVPPVELFEKGPEFSEDGKQLWSCGGFEPQSASIRLNSEAPIFDDFDAMLDTIVHENTHNYQQKLIDQLEAGTLDKGSPEYNQAVLFQLNQPPLGYLGGTSDGYEEQSTEEHAWKAGREAKQLFPMADERDEANLLLAKIDDFLKLIAGRMPEMAAAFKRIREETVGSIEKADSAIAIRIARMEGEIAFNTTVREALAK